MTNAVPFLTFQPAKGQSAENAMRFYVDLFEDGEVLSHQQHPDDSSGAGTIMLAVTGWFGPTVTV